MGLDVELRGSCLWTREGMLGAANRMGATLPPFELVLEMDMRLSVP